MLTMGVNNPRPRIKHPAPETFRVIRLQSNYAIECWYSGKADTTRNDPEEKGAVAIFHGYGAEKSGMLDKAVIFDSLGYDVLLVDFMGCGGSEGNKTSIGFHEAEQVKTAFEFLAQKGYQKIYLHGTSMGAAAIMKAIQDHQLQASGLILECPFNTMYETVAARFDHMRLPRFPMAGLLVFWGGIQNNFWAFDHNPETYAASIKVPVLLMVGGQDKNVSLAATRSIYHNLQGAKQLSIYPLAGHENYLNQYRAAWIHDVAIFTGRP
ncbi:MAG: alpha/beta fold hydrolase [Sphingobacteriales bacterium]|nr:MAG: alpha/beta fold hydrolase [Sphingobacteriales bacterium]